jgi:hypothetical protein
MKAGWGKACVLVICAMLASALPAAYAKEKSKHSRSVKAADQGIHAGVEIFVGKDREVIRQYFRDHAGNLPPGLAKRRGTLPPGLEKQLRRRGHLPPGLEKKVAVFPVELERRLPPLKPGLTRGFLEGKAVIMDERTSVILDIFTIF